MFVLLQVIKHGKEKKIVIVIFGVESEERARMSE